MWAAKLSYHCILGEGLGVSFIGTVNGCTCALENLHKGTKGTWTMLLHWYTYTRFAQGDLFWTVFFCIVSKSFRGMNRFLPPDL